MPSSGSCGQSTRGVIFNFGYLGTNKKRSTDPDISCHKYPIPDDTPLPFGHRKIMPRAGQRPLRSHVAGSARWRSAGADLVAEDVGGQHDGQDDEVEDPYTGVHAELLVRPASEARPPFSHASLRGSRL